MAPPADSPTDRKMVPIAHIIWHETRVLTPVPRRPETTDTMDDAEQVKAYVQAYEWDGPTAALQLHHLKELSRMIRPGDTVVDLACGPGPLVLDLAALYPDVTFIGVDLSTTMLAHLEETVRARGLDNVRVLQEDIRRLPSLPDGSADLVISTSALHHLPTVADLGEVFRRMRTLLRPEGGFYLFDFGLLKSRDARRLFVREVAKLAPAITAEDYAASLDAAFPLDTVIELAEAVLPRPFVFRRSAFVDFCYWLQTGPRATCPSLPGHFIAEVSRDLSAQMNLEHAMLRLLRGTQSVA